MCVCVFVCLFSYVCVFVCLFSCVCLCVCLAMCLCGSVVLSMLLLFVCLFTHNNDILCVHYLPIMCVLVCAFVSVESCYHADSERRAGGRELPDQTQLKETWLLCPHFGLQSNALPL